MSALRLGEFPSPNPTMTTVCPKDIYIWQPYSPTEPDPKTPPRKPTPSPPPCPGAPHKPTLVEEESSPLESEEPMSQDTIFPTITPPVRTSPRATFPPKNLSKTLIQFLPQSSTSEAFPTHSPLPSTTTNPRHIASNPNPLPLFPILQAGQSPFTGCSYYEQISWLTRPLLFAREDHYCDELALEPHERQVMYAAKDHYCDRFALSPSPTSKSNGSDELDLENDIQSLQNGMQAFNLRSKGERERGTQTQTMRGKFNGVDVEQHQITTRSQTKKTATQLGRSNDLLAAHTRRERQRRARKQQDSNVPNRGRTIELKNVSGNRTRKHALRREETPCASAIEGLRRSRRLQGLQDSVFEGENGRLEDGKARKRRAGVKGNAPAVRGEGYRRSERLQRRRG